MPKTLGICALLAGGALSVLTLMPQQLAAANPALTPPLLSITPTVIDYQATGLFTPANRDIPQTDFSFAFSAPENALHGIVSYSTPSTLAFSNGLTIPSTLTFTPTVLKQVGEQSFIDGNEFDFFQGFDLPLYRFFLAGDNITDGRRSDQPGDLTDTNFVTGIHVGDANSMITYHVSSPFAVPGTSFITTPLDSFSITGTVAPVPETSSMGLLSLLTCASGWFIARAVGRRIKGAPENVEIETT
jgi:hypothetical protein